MKVYTSGRKRRLIFFPFMLFTLVFAACSSSPGAQAEPGLSLELSEDLSPGTPVLVSPQDSFEFTRRIAAAAEKKLRATGRTAGGVEVLLRSQLQQWEDGSPGFLSKRYEIYLDGMLLNQDSSRIGSLTGRLVYKRTRFRLAAADEAGQFEQWDQDFVMWSARKVREALTF